MALIRDAVLSDAPRLLEIYGHYVRRTAVSFEYDVPAPEVFRQRMAALLGRWPYLVAEQDGVLLGYAYAAPFHARAAYGWCSELTIYLDPAAVGQGLGRSLYTALEQALKAMGLRNLYACIALPAASEDPFLTGASAAFHARMGFQTVGTFRNCGYKFGRWYHMIWMEKVIAPHGTNPPPVRAYPE